MLGPCSLQVVVQGMLVLRMSPALQSQIMHERLGRLAGARFPEHMQVSDAFRTATASFLTAAAALSGWISL